TLLRNGTVLVAGGAENSGGLSIALADEPVTGTWARVSSIKSPRTIHTGTPLPHRQGRAAGGAVEFSWPVIVISSSAELYQPSGSANPVPVSPKLISSTLADGAFGFRFLSLPLTTFTVLSTTNASLPVSDWTVLGGATEFAPGLY